MFPKLFLGIGIDDTFVMLGAWRRTSIHSSVPERMSASFEDAAVSITITSVTNMISFWIGVITPFPSVQIFCIYTGKLFNDVTFEWKSFFEPFSIADVLYLEESVLLNDVTL